MFFPALCCHTWYFSHSMQKGEDQCIHSTSIYKLLYFQVLYVDPEDRVVRSMARNIQSSWTLQEHSTGEEMVSAQGCRLSNVNLYKMYKGDCSSSLGD